VYVPRHDPTLFFQDVAGGPPSAGNAYCASHHRPLSALAGDLASGAVASYVFITPDLRHDMHGSPSCPTDANVRAGDDWLGSALPPLIAYVNAHGGVIFVTWDEGSPLPFIAVGPHVKAGYRSTVRFNHGSMLKSVEEILQLPMLPTVQNVSDLSDLFTGGAMP
jgi:phosphatidylinositol-3-phosphatase